MNCTEKKWRPTSSSTPRHQKRGPSRTYSTISVLNLRRVHDLAGNRPLLLAWLTSLRQESTIYWQRVMTHRQLEQAQACFWPTLPAGTATT